MKKMPKKICELVGGFFSREKADLVAELLNEHYCKTTDNTPFKSIAAEAVGATAATAHPDKG